MGRSGHKQWYGTITGDEIDLTTVNPGTYRYQYTITVAGCGTASSILTVNVNAGPEAGVDNAAFTCSDESNFDLIGNLSGSPDTGGLWTDLDGSGAVISGNSADFTNVAAGQYRFEYRISVAGCADDVAVLTVDVGTIPNPAYTVVDAACNGVGSGSITITGVTGGVPVYSYSLNGGASQTSNVFSNLSTGTYSLVAVDGNGCTSVPEPITINANSFILPTISKVDAECIGKANGVITISSVAFGSGSYEYSFDNGASYGSSSVKSGLEAGSNYSVLVRDVNTLCVSSVTSIIINADTEITTSISKTNASSCNGSDGSITVNASGGATPYLYSIDGGVSFPSSVNVFSSLNQGTYQVVVQDNNGCLSETETVSIDLIGNIVPVIAKTDASCIGQNDGTITISSVTGGTAPYQYSIQNGDAGTYVATSIFNSLPADNYSVIVKDANGCISSVHSVVIDNDIVITMDVNKIDETCAGGDGQITITNVSGGTGPYDYSTNNVSGPFGASNVIDDLSLGVYNVVVRDANGCMSESVMTAVSKPSNCTTDPGSASCLAFNTAFSEVRPSCADQDDGEITITVTLGDPAVPNVLITLYDSVSMPIFTKQVVVAKGTPHTFGNLSPSNNYKYEISDGTYNCTDRSYGLPLQTVVEATSAPSSWGNAICYDEPTGQAIIVVQGGNSPYEYSSDNGTTWEEFSSGQTISNLPPNGTYPILVRDDLNDLCPAEVVVTINNAPTKIAADAEASEATCNNNDGQLEISNVTGGTAPYEISFQGGLFEPLNGSIIYPSLPRGIKHYTISDAMGCSLIDSVNIPSPNQVILETPDVDAPTCASQGSDGKVTITVDMDETETPGPYKYGIAKNGEDESTIVMQAFPSSGNSVTITDLEAGDYFVLASSDAGCPTRQDFTVGGGPIAVTFNAAKECAGNVQNIMLTNITGDSSDPFDILVFNKHTGLRVDSIRVSPFPETASYFISDRDFLGEKGEYSIRLKQNQDVCPGTPIKSELQDVLIQYPVGASVEGVSASYPDIATGSLLIQNFAGGEPEYSISIRLDSAATKLDYFERRDEIVGQNSNLDYEMNYERVLPAGRYVIEVEDALGCTFEMTALVPLDETVYIPNVFTPNGDNINDMFFIRNLPEGASNKLIITNRWGKEVYSNNNYQNNWNGEGAADGIYFYHLKVSGGSPITGWVEVLRGKAP
jgi:gliding motility-associated-like protein